VHVVRCFEDENVVHVDGSIDPVRDIETINLELIFADLEVLERRISKVARTAKMDKTAGKEMILLKRIKEHLEDGKPASSVELQSEEEEKWFADYNLLTAKPVIYAANVSEDDLMDDGASNEGVAAVREYAAKTGCIVTAEEHNIYGGLGSAVCESLCDTEPMPVPVVRVGINDVFGTSGKAKEVLDYFGLNAANLVQKAKEAISRKNS